MRDNTTCYVVMEMIQKKGRSMKQRRWEINWRRDNIEKRREEDGTQSGRWALETSGDRFPTVTILLVCLGPCTLPGVTMPWASPGVSRCAACQTLWGERKGSQALGEASNSAVTTAGLSLRSRILVPSWTRSAYHFSWPPVQLTILSLLLSFSHETTQVS